MRTNNRFSRAFLVGLVLALSAGIHAGGVDTGGGVKNKHGETGGGVKNLGDTGGGVKNKGRGGDTGGGVKNAADDDTGGGVKNKLRDLFGGVGVSCPDSPEFGVEMMDTREARRQAHASVERTDDHLSFHERVRERARRAAGGDPALFRLADAIYFRATSFGRADRSWFVATEAADANFTLLSEYARKEGEIEHIDRERMRVRFKKGRGRLAGCTLYQVSWFARSASGVYIDRPMLFGPNFAELDVFNARVLELHEAVYSLAVSPTDACAFDPGPARALVGALIRSDLAPQDLAQAMRDFLARCRTPRAIAPMIEWRLDGGLGY